MKHDKKNKVVDTLNKILEMELAGAIHGERIQLGVQPRMEVKLDSSGL